MFLSTGGAPTLFDAGFADTVEAVAEGLAELGTEPERLIVTHGDDDHVGRFDGLVNRYDPETWVPRRTALETNHDSDHRYGDGDRVGRFTAVHPRARTRAGQPRSDR